MPTDEPGRSKSPGAFRRSVSDQLKNRRDGPGAAPTLRNLIRRFLQERFLARVFADPESPWALKGRLSMLVRVPRRARYSRDVDLVHLPGNPEQAVEDLRRLLAAPADDPLWFQVTGIRRVDSHAALQVMVEVYAGTAKWDEFPVDVSCELHFVGELERCRLTPVLPPERIGLPPLPTIVLYPVADQVADKVTAMYELHGEDQNASNRWRDLADLVLLVLESDGLNAAELGRALLVRREAARSPVTLPASMQVPGPEWQTQYPRFATRETLIPEEFRDLEEAVRLVGRCLDPVLDGSLAAGRWDPIEQRWRRG